MMRMGMRRFTRLTKGFSKKFENHAYSCDSFPVLQFWSSSQNARDHPGDGGRNLPITSGALRKSLDWREAGNEFGSLFIPD
jgi:hypothetical protein